MDSVRRTRQRMAPEDRQAQIVAVARNILIDQGYGALTLRAVASGCQVSLAAVQHHYRDKAELVKQLIESVIEEYDDRYEQVMQSSQGDPVRRLREFLDFLISHDIKSHRSAGFFYEMWNLAYRDPTIGDAMTRLYDLQLNRICDLMQEIDPSADKRTALSRAGVVAAATDGLMLTMGASKNSELLRSNVSPTIMVDLLVSLATRTSGEHFPT